MAELKVEVVKIDRIQPHPNADRMQLAFVGGYQVCIQLGQFHEGELAVYIPVDSVLTPELEMIIFGPDSKVKLKDHRVRSIKLRGAMSQGMLISLVMANHYAQVHHADSRQIWDEGTDITLLLDITKYQPPVKVPNAMSGGQPKEPKYCHPQFSRYTSIDHLRKNWSAFEEDEDIYLTEKLHGTNFRAGWVPYKPKSFIQKLKTFLGFSPHWEFVYGSHNVQLEDGGRENVYKRVVDQYKLKDIIDNGELWYAEIIGCGIQKGYEYGYTDGDVAMFVMDIKNSVTKEFMDFDYVESICHFNGVPIVPFMLVDFDKVEILKMLNHPDAASEVDMVTQPLEGFVIRPKFETSFYGGRKILKIKSDAFLLKDDNTDWH